MPANNIPARQTVGDPFSGVALRSASTWALALKPEAGGEVVASGNFVIRYGLQYLGKPHLSIVPGLVALDYGDMLTGEDAWEFLLKRSNLHPRADVIGYRNDGVDNMIVVKLLDLAQPAHVLVYSDPHAIASIARITALIAHDIGNLSPRLVDNLPHYQSIGEWQAAVHV